MRLQSVFFVLIAFILTKAHPQSAASIKVTKFMIAAPQLDTSKNIWVYLPKNYKDSKIDCPAIYMHDAQNLFDSETLYAGKWKVDEYLDTLSKNQSIIIGIAHGNKKRIDELTPYQHEKHGGGNGDHYLTFIKNPLKPHADVTYSTKPEAKHTTIFGSSLGSLISFYAVIANSDTFGKAGVFSPSFWINKEIYDWVETSSIPNTTKFYFLAGTDESETMVTDQERMVTLLREKGIKDSQIKKHNIEEGQHNERFWAAHFENAYQCLYDKPI
jgi:predicted alpha/beta superfamily hydrolase